MAGYWNGGRFYGHSPFLVCPWTCRKCEEKKNKVALAKRSSGSGTKKKQSRKNVVTNEDVDIYSKDGAPEVRSSLQQPAFRR